MLDFFFSLFFYVKPKTPFPQSFRRLILLFGSSNVIQMHSSFQKFKITSSPDTPQETPVLQIWKGASTEKFPEPIILFFVKISLAGGMTYGRTEIDTPTHTCTRMYGLIDIDINTHTRTCIDGMYIRNNIYKIFLILALVVSGFERKMRYVLTLVLVVSVFERKIRHVLVIAVVVSVLERKIRYVCPFRKSQMIILSILSYSFGLF